MPSSLRENGEMGGMEAILLSVPHPPLGLVLGSLGSGVRTVLEEAGCLRDFVKTPSNDRAALGLAVLELRGKPFSPLSHGMWSPPSLDTLKTGSNIGNKKTARQMNMGIYTWHQWGKW